MKRADVIEWVAALTGRKLNRQGKPYKQTDGNLRVTEYKDGEPVADKFCCIGVLADLHTGRKTCWRVDEDEEQDDFEPFRVWILKQPDEENNAQLDEALLKKFGLHWSWQDFLIKCNDNGWSFKTIAAIILKYEDVLHEPFPFNRSGLTMQLRRNRNEVIIRDEMKIKGARKRKGK